MAKRLYIGNLPFTASNEDLEQLFSQVGAVSSASVMVDKFSGKSRGFGFVEMSNDGEADEAVNRLNGTDMGGRKIVVNEARPMGERDRRGGGGFDRGPRERGFYRKDF